ncbi:putative type VI secretion system effector [Paraburkholderia nodosa]|uniref:putative type VI secretion system effector n=1 Tax=Paraburkholderia nodosa TaxID=392320 RepID=UPI0008421783|nr:putative type VI secretion system effector [Paraburkholderia nodosa]
MKNQESRQSTVLLSGTISELKRSRRTRDFVLTQVQHRQIGATAVAASLMGAGAIGIGLISMAGNSEEEADWVQFNLDGKQVEGWLWMMPMLNGDSVEVAAEQIGENRYVAYAVRRKEDGLLAIYPHATAGRSAHFRKSVKAWILVSIAMYAILPILWIAQRGVEIFQNEGVRFGLLIALPFWMVFSGIIALRVSWKLMGFVRMAEYIFSIFEWKNIQKIDLRKISRKNRLGDTSAKFGNLYFRYKE